MRNDLQSTDKYFDGLKAVGVDFTALTDKLQVDGVELFSKSYHP